MKAVMSCVVAGLVSLFGSGVAFGQQLSAEEWREDLQHLARVIDEIHPNPYLFHDRGAFEVAVAELSAAIPELTDDQVIMGMARIGAMIRDGHSFLRPLSQRFPLTEFAPIRLFSTPDGWIVGAVAEEAAWALGGVVETIAGRPADEVMAELARHGGADNAAQQAYSASFSLAIGRLLRGLGLVGEDGVLSLTVEDARAAEVRALDIPVVSMRASFGWTQSPFAAPGEATRSIIDDWSEAPLAFRHQGMQYWSEYVPGEDILYVQINEINDSSRPASVDGAESVLSLTDFLSKSLALTEDHPTDRLVIDLRFNGGGDNFEARAMMRTLHQYPELNQKGRLFVLTGGQTYSAAMNFVSMLEAYTDALFVGEPPGGRPNHFGDARSFPLPNSGLVARVSSLNWQLGVNPWDIRRLMEPDIPAPFDQASLRAGRDPALDAVIAFEDGSLLADRMIAAYEQSGVEGAMALFASEVQPGEPGVWHHRPGVLFNFGFQLLGRGVDEPEVAGVFVGAAQMYSDSPSVLFSIGRIAGRVPNWPIAAQMYEGALALWPENKVIETHLARARLELEAAARE